MHAACPEVEETIKWRQPSFDYKGLMCGMAAFKEHCVFGYWKAPLVLGAAAEGANAMGYRDKITTVADLPSKSAFRGTSRRRWPERGLASPSNVPAKARNRRRSSA